jgi:hypothetical protein
VQVETVQNKTKDICRYEAQLRGFEPNDAHNNAINRRQHPAFPTPSANEYCGHDSQHTGYVIKSQHECEASLRLIISSFWANSL